MLVKQIMYDAKTDKTREEWIEVEDIQEPTPKPQPTTEERVAKLEATDIDLIATNWAMDDRIFEIEWFLEDLEMPNKFNLREVKAMAGMSKFEQAKILILAGEYERKTMENQLRKYESRGLITKDELDILISMMDAQELVEGK